MQAVMSKLIAINKQTLRTVFISPPPKNYITTQNEIIGKNLEVFYWAVGSVKVIAKYEY